MKPACRDLQSHFSSHHHDGKQGLENADRRRVDMSLACSVTLDEWGKPDWPRDARWDYVVVDSASRTLAVEVHPATDGEVASVIKKKAWAETRLAEAEVAAGQWWWIPSGKSTITPTGRRRRQLSLKGIHLSRRVLDRQQVEKVER